jgi:hypothetical protein
MENGHVRETQVMTEDKGLNCNGRFDFMTEEAKRLGSDSVGYVLPSLWDRASGCVTPREIWPATRLVVVLAIVTAGCMHSVTECSILNGMAYRFAVWLSGKGVASVFLPCGENVGNEFSHDIAAELAGLFMNGPRNIRPVSVLTSYGDV